MHENLTELIKRNETLLIKTEKEELSVDDSRNELKTISFSFSEILPLIDSIYNEINNRKTGGGSFKRF